MKLRFVGLVLAAALPCAPFGYAQSPNVAASRSAGRTATPIKHIVIIYGENISFDHYFATYPNATNLPGERPFRAAGDTPKVNGFTHALLTHNRFALPGRSRNRKL
jgi:phospholipase C